MRTLRLLVAEDDDDHAELIQIAIEESPVRCEILRVRNGEEALAVLNREGDFSDEVMPHAILADINMPRVNGLEVAKFVKQNKDLLHIPVIILTTSDADHDKQRAFEVHVNSYLVKPIEYDQLLQMLSDVLNYWSTWNRSLEH